MSPVRHRAGVEDEGAQIRSLARPLQRVADLDGLVDTVGDDRFVCLGEASHGTHDFYRWRAALSRRLISERGSTWFGVEGDWPDCWRINRWVRGHEHQDRSAAELLAGFETVADLDVGEPGGRRVPGAAARVEPPQARP